MGKTGIIATVGAVVAAAAGTVTVTTTDILKPVPQTIIEQPAEPPLPDLFSYDEPDAEETLSAQDQIEFCVHWLEVNAECINRKELLALSDDPLIRRELRLALSTPAAREKPMQLSLVHPTDISIPARVVLSCDQFNDAKAEDWGPLTSADMVEEQWFIARCGIFKMAALANTHTTSGFENGRMSTNDLQNIDMSRWPYMGEIPEEMTLSLRRPADAITRRDNDRLWVADYGDMETLVSDIAHADFNNDGSADILVLLGGRLKGGTANIATYALVEKTDDAVTMTAVELY